MKGKVLITGASGFIGGFLVEKALERGYDVWAGVRPGSNCDRLTDSRIRRIHLNYADPAALTAQLREATRESAWTYVIHNAGLTKALHKQDFLTVNAGYTRNLVDALAAACIPQKFLLMSSLSSFGPGDEKHFSPILPDAPQRPDTAYGKSKLEAENILRRQTHFPYIILRPTGVYGPGDRDYLMVLKSIRAGFDLAVGCRPQRITFIYVKDLVRAAFLALENGNLRNREYFVADGDVYTDAEFARLARELLDKRFVFRARIPAGPVYVACCLSEWMGRLSGRRMTLNTDKYVILKQRNWICDVAPLEDETGFSPGYSLKEGLQESIAWYRQAGLL
jgi:nucleoside-diphosphate-sugar epimerase